MKEAVIREIRAHQNKGTIEGKPSFELPDAPIGPVIREPVVIVPAPERWLEPETVEPLPIIGADKDGLNDVTSNAIGLRMLERLDAVYDESPLVSGGTLYLYRDGVMVPVSDEDWLDPAFQLYHKTESYQQQQGAPDAGMPWFFNPSNLAAAKKSLLTKMRARQSGDPLAGSTALAVFGTQTLGFDRATQDVVLAPNAPEWRALHRYPFEFTFEPCEPLWLTRILREDTFAGVEEGERELRIERIRQQMGMAMLGCQHMTNLHSVLIMKGHGHDGKSTLLELLQLCMPLDSCVTMSPQELSRGTGDGAEGRARLRGKFAVICDDISSKAMRDSSHYKTATAYGKVAGRFFGSGRNTFEFAPRATWFLACQELWETDDKTRGFQRRHCIVEFPNSIKESSADRKLARKLYSLERERIIVWACQAAIALLRGGNLARPECSERLMAAWMRGDDDVVSFVESCTRAVTDSESWPTVEYLHTYYVRWCEWCGAKPRTLPEFAKRARSVKGWETKRATKDGKKDTHANRVPI